MVEQKLDDGWNGREHGLLDDGWSRWEHGLWAWADVKVGQKVVNSGLDRWFDWWLEDGHQRSRPGKKRWAAGRWVTSCWADDCGPKGVFELPKNLVQQGGCLKDWVEVVVLFTQWAW